MAHYTEPGTARFEHRRTMLPQIRALLRERRKARAPS